MYRPLWIEIDLRALRKNFKEIRTIVGKKVGMMATLKQEAYGHGLLPVARELSLMGVDFFGVGSLEEAITLRKNGFKEHILILSSAMPKYTKEFFDYKITPTVMDLDFARELNKEAAKRRRRIPIHIKIDTGMGRLGIWHEECLSFVKKLSSMRNIILEGFYTHFPCADTDAKFTRTQIRIFNSLIDQLKREGIEFKYLHCANSIGVIKYKESHFNLVRPGLIIYGIKPDHCDVELKPILSLKSKVIFIKKVKKGRSISYGRTFMAKSPTTIATVAIGYADGYPWVLSNKASVIINNKFFNLIGRVCMDHVMIDLGRNSGVNVGDVVTLIGKSSNFNITAEDIAKWTNTIPYEVVSRLSLNIPRLYKGLSYKNNSAYSHRKKK